MPVSDNPNERVLIPALSAQVGVVIIGRNEGDRLKTCVDSLAAFDVPIVYVDSHSSDGSVEFVQSRGHDVVSLDMSIPFSAARARNAGCTQLLAQCGDLEFIQFVDGDCELEPEWLPAALQVLLDQPRLAAVCGRRKERYPERTIYNALCDIEWDTPVGIALSTGGDFMCRASAFVEVDGFTNSVIAGEEPELCFRLRNKGWLIKRIDMPMTRHDADMHRFSQWWKRCVRCGHAFAQGYSLHGNSEEKYYHTEVVRILKWNGLILLICVFSFFLSPWFLLGMCILPLKVYRLYQGFKNKLGPRLSILYSSSLMLGKIAEAQGAITFCINKMLGKQPEIIEYKDPQKEGEQ